MLTRYSTYYRLLSIALTCSLNLGYRQVSGAMVPADGELTPTPCLCLSRPASLNIADPTTSEETPRRPSLWL